MKIDYSDPRFLKFMTENIEKTQEKRLLWFNKNKARILKSAVFPENYKDIRTEEVGKKYLSMCLPSLAKDYESSMVNRRKKPARDNFAAVKALSASTSEQTDAVPNAVMLPIDPSVENILKMPLPEGGRKQYLKARNLLSPEEKYYYDETTSCQYGWKLNDSLVPQRPPTYGRFNCFSRDLRSRTGPNPDPSHYYPPPKDPYFKC